MFPTCPEANEKMRGTILKRAFAVAIMVFTLAAGNALAERGDRGHGDSGDRGHGDSGGRGHGDSGGGRSWSARGGGDGGGSSVRSMSRGGSSESGPSMSRSFLSRPQSRPSFSGSSESTRSMNRSFEGIRPNRGSGDDGSSFRGLSRGGPSISQRSYRPSNRGSFEVGPPPGSSNDGAAAILRSFGNAGPDGNAGAGSSSFGRRGGGDDSKRFSANRFSGESNRLPRQLQGLQSPTVELPQGGGDARSARSQWSPAPRQQWSGRPTNDQVREFLQLRRDDSVQQTENVTVGQGIDGNFRRGDGNRKFTGNLPGDNVQSNLRDRLGAANSQGQHDGGQQLGDTHGSRVDRSFRPTPRDGDWSDHLGDANRLDKGPKDGDRHLAHRLGDKADGGSRNFADRNFRDRDFGDRKDVDQKYRDWRNNAWTGEHGKGRDHRDWSGRWKDGDRFAAANHIRDHWRHDNDDDHDDLPFHGGWWENHHWRHWDHWDHFAVRHYRPWYWWNWCSAPRLTTWITFGWGTPYYWDYGPGEYIYCVDNVVYVNGRWFQPAPVYYEQTALLAQRAPDWTPEQAAQVEWLPLGVFAVTRDGVPEGNLLVQLAVTKEGVIGGTVFNQATGKTFAAEGTVDKQSQRAVWSYVDDKNVRIVMETSVYNLTQPESTGLIHYGPNDIQVIELVRLEQPTADAAAPQATTPAEALPVPPPVPVQ